MEPFTERAYKTFELFNKDWALVTAGPADDYNTMVVSWGEMGTIWGRRMQGRHIVTVFIHPARYTSVFLKKYKQFTVSFYDKKYMSALGYLGSHSGRDGDKVAKSGLTPVPIGNGVTFEEAEMTFLCRKLYMHQMSRDDLAEEIREYYASAPGTYPNVTADGSGETWEPHYAVIGEIVETKGELPG